MDIPALASSVSDATVSEIGQTHNLVVDAFLMILPVEKPVLGCNVVRTDLPPLPKGNTELQSINRSDRRTVRPNKKRMGGRARHRALVWIRHTVTIILSVLRV